MVNACKNPKIPFVIGSRAVLTIVVGRFVLFWENLITGLLADNIWIICSETAWWRGIWIAPKIIRSWDPTIVRAWDYFDSHVSRFPIVDLSKDMWKDFECPAANPRVVISNYCKNHGQQETPIMSTYIKCTPSMGSEKPITSFSRHFVVDPLTSSYIVWVIC
jgi:hypothetical protein